MLLTALMIVVTFIVSASLVVVVGIMLHDLREDPCAGQDGLPQAFKDHLALTVRRSFTSASRARPRVLGSFIL